MNNKAINFIRNFSYSLSSNLISMIISTLVILVVPKLIGIKSYGYWQLYIFYSSYVGFLHFGWNDGIYLRYGGKEYKQLNKNLLFSQFWLLFLFEVLIGFVIVFTSTILKIEANKLFILKMTTLCMLIVNSELMLNYILQCTNRIKEYAQIVMIEKILYCILILLFLLIGIREYKLLITADIIGKLISLIYATYCCNEIVFRKIKNIYIDFKEIFENISVGIKLTFANIAGMLIIGIVRFSIERTWSVATFGKISLTLSISNLVMVFINAIGVILFPILRRTDNKMLPSIFLTARTFLIVPILGLLMVYFPLESILSAWLPQYTDSLKYMAILFPMFIYEGKMALLISTYLKTLRKETIMLTTNLLTVILSGILTILFTTVYKSLSLTIVSIILLLAFRSNLAELFLAKTLKVPIFKDAFLELAMTIVFILIGWFLKSWTGLILYLGVYVLYLLIKRKDISITFKNIKSLIRKAKN
ncbi:lipopolysaccharide biosynthesis protein [Heyndrickxia coagulans]|uniref:lipopolysaccharide biosynthesis protein n=1 Tax=Heyndrickxia coagulans TaxID=1398 RepID=UPI000E4EA361|nr:hypothetical protein [Heyndrickxia coagulans]RGR95826.1 hypothetical protein DWY16_12375 [Heyndrickxia coagulans]